MESPHDPHMSAWTPRVAQLLISPGIRKGRKVPGPKWPPRTRLPGKMHIRGGHRDHCSLFGPENIETEKEEKRCRMRRLENATPRRF